MTSKELFIIKDIKNCSFSQVKAFLNVLKSDRDFSHPYLNRCKLTLKRYSFDSYIYQSKNNKFIKHGEYIPKVEKTAIIVNSSSITDKSKWLDVVHRPNRKWVAKTIRPNDKKVVYLNMVISDETHSEIFQKASEFNKKKHLMDNFINKHIESEDLKIKIFVVGLALLEITGCRPGIARKLNTSDSRGIYSLLNDDVILNPNGIRIKFSAKCSVQYDKEFTINNLALYRGLEYFKNKSFLLFFPYQEVYLFILINFYAIFSNFLYKRHLKHRIMIEFIATLETNFLIYFIKISILK